MHSVKPPASYTWARKHVRDHHFSLNVLEWVIICETKGMAVCHYFTVVGSCLQWITVLMGVLTLGIILSMNCSHFWRYTCCSMDLPGATVVLWCNCLPLTSSISRNSFQSASHPPWHCPWPQTFQR